MMKRALTLALLLAAIVSSTGCTLAAPRYSPSLQNVQTLKNAGVSAAKVGTFATVASKSNANPISLRGSSLNSPYDNSYAKYLEEAVKQELSLAGKLAADTDIEISGALQKND